MFGYIFGYSSSTVEGWHSSDYDYREYISGNTYTYYYYHVPESLTKVTVTGRSIGAFAFKNCTSLTSIVIGYSVISIEREAFTGCTSLAAVYYMGTAEELSTLVNSSNNEIFMSTTKYYYIENEADVPTDGGNYWHYDENGNIAIW